MGMGLPRRLASWKAVWSNQSSFSSAKYRMVLGKSVARAARREGRTVAASGGQIETLSSGSATPHGRCRS